MNIYDQMRKDSEGTRPLYRERGYQKIERKQSKRKPRSTNSQARGTYCHHHAPPPPQMVSWAKFWVCFRARNAEWIKIQNHGDRGSYHQKSSPEVKSFCHLSFHSFLYHLSCPVLYLSFPLFSLVFHTLFPIYTELSPIYYPPPGIIICSVYPLFS